MWHCRSRPHIQCQSIDWCGKRDICHQRQHRNPALLHPPHIHRQPSVCERFARDTLRTGMGGRDAYHQQSSHFGIIATHRRQVLSLSRHRQYTHCGQPQRHWRPSRRLGRTTAHRLLRRQQRHISLNGKHAYGEQRHAGQGMQPQHHSDGTHTTTATHHDHAA